jgi:hypothetical protein
MRENIEGKYTDSRNVSIRTVADIIYVRYTVEDGTVLIDKWKRTGDTLECVATRVY